MRVAITTPVLWPPGGLACYTRDVALELQRQGHQPAVISSSSGSLADELCDAGIPVTAWPSRLPWSPEIIHGQFAPSTRLALHAWPTVPAIHVCHGHTATAPRAPLDPQIARYIGVSRVCVERLIRDGVAADRAELLPNSVDVTRFHARAPLPMRPRRSLMFSNYADPSGYLPAVADACAQAGLELDVVGAASGNMVTRPELMLGQYDIVFAKARAAMEAMAVGAAVILCDFSGLGPMVSSAIFEELRPLNFGFAALREPLRAELILRQIGRYDAADATRVRDRIRADARLDGMVRRLVGIYERAILEHRTVPRPVARHQNGIARDFVYTRLMRVWTSVPAPLRARLTRLPGAQQFLVGVRRTLGYPP